MSWFSAEELQRTEAYHGPLGRMRALTGTAELAALALVAVVVPASPPSATPWAAAARLGALVALAGLGPRLAGAWWRELWLERRHGLVEAAPTMAPAVVVAVVLLDEGLQAVGRALLVAVLAVAVAQWSAASAVVGLLVVPALAVGSAPVVVALGRAWRRRVDRVVPLTPQTLPSALAVLASRLPAGQVVQWCRGGPATSRRGEGAYVVAGPRCSTVVFSPEVLDGPAALLEAVAAHEVGHLLRPRRGLPGVGTVAVRGAAVAVTTVTVGLTARLALRGEPPGPAAAAVVAVSLVALTVVGAARSRRIELGADRRAAALVGDPRAAAQAVRAFLLGSGADLRPVGIRRLWASYPPAEVRLTALVGSAPPA